MNIDVTTKQQTRMLISQNIARSRPGVHDRAENLGSGRTRDEATIHATLVDNRTLGWMMVSGSHVATSS
jgi:hypothetical protein